MTDAMTAALTTPTLDPLLLLIAAGWIAALLLHGALAKLADRGLFHQHVAAYGVPEALQPALVWALPLAEAMAATGAPLLDVSSGVERTPGYKDAKLIRAFLDAVRGAARADSAVKADT